MNVSAASNEDLASQSSSILTEDVSSMVTDVICGSTSLQLDDTSLMDSSSGLGNNTSNLDEHLTSQSSSILTEHVNSIVAELIGGSRRVHMGEVHSRNDTLDPKEGVISTGDNIINVQSPLTCGDSLENGDFDRNRIERSVTDISRVTRSNNSYLVQTNGLVVAFTGVDYDVCTRFASKLQVIGAEVLLMGHCTHEVDLMQLDRVTHMVVGIPVRRTCKLMAVLPLKVRLVNISWIEYCINHNDMLVSPMDNHILHGVHMVGVVKNHRVPWRPAEFTEMNRMCLCELVFIVPCEMGKSRSPSKRDLKIIIKNNGGKMIYGKHAPSLVDVNSRCCFVITDTKQKAIRIQRASHIVLCVYDVKLIYDAIIMGGIPKGDSLMKYVLAPIHNA